MAQPPRGLHARPSCRELAVNLRLICRLAEHQLLPIRTGVQSHKVRSGPLGNAFRFTGRRAGMVIDAGLPKIVITRYYATRSPPRVDHPAIRKPAKIFQPQVGGHNHRSVRHLQVAGFDRMLIAVRTALHSNVGQALSIRRPVHRVQPVILSDREDLSRIVSLAAHHPDFANVARGSQWAESDVCPIRRNAKTQGAFAELSWRCPEHRDRPHALVSARFVGVREQLCAVGEPRIDNPEGAGGNSVRPWDEPLFPC